MTGCLCHDETSDKFRFSVTGADLSTGTGNGITGGSGGEMVTYNIQVRVWYLHIHWTEAKYNYIEFLLQNTIYLHKC